MVFCIYFNLNNLNIYIDSHIVRNFFIIGDKFSFVFLTGIVNINKPGISFYYFMLITEMELILAVLLQISLVFYKKNPRCRTTTYVA